VCSIYTNELLVSHARPVKGLVSLNTRSSPAEAVQDRDFQNLKSPMRFEIFEYVTQINTRNRLSIKVFITDSISS